MTRNDALMIEGSPRNGTSFAVQATQQANPDLVGRIATHLHTPAHLFWATQLGVPGLVLVRDPSTAAPLMIALEMQTGVLELSGASDAAKGAFIAQATRRYAAFHEVLLDLRDRMVIVRFEDTTEDLVAVIDALNRRFGTRFSRLGHTPEVVAESFNLPKRLRRFHLSPDTFLNEVNRILSAHYAAAANTRNCQAAEQAYAAC